MNDSVSLKSIFLLVVVLGLASTTGRAQDSRISGRVADSTGGVIPGVEVTVTNLDTGVSRQAVTDDWGRYAVPQLFAGNYRVSASMAGFDAQQLELLLDPSQTTDQNFQLSVGVPTTVVEVAASSARINVNPYDMATVIEEKQIEQLPLLGRNVLALAGLSPGILKGQQGGRGNQAESGFKSGGLAMEHVAISLDGIDNTGRVVFGPLATQSQTAKPPPEAIAEFKSLPTTPRPSTEPRREPPFSSPPKGEPTCSMVAFTNSTAMQPSPPTISCSTGMDRVIRTMS